MSGRDLGGRLQHRARLAGVEIGQIPGEALEAYYQLLAKWNAKINLTAFRLTSTGEDDAIDRLLVEPLIAARHLPVDAETLLDAGSGGGSPAIPLKLARPRLHVRMVEAKTRKAVFLREAVRALGLKGAEVETARFEELLLRPELHESHDVVSVRAVRIERRTLLTLQAFLRPGGKIFLFRGTGGIELTDAMIAPLAWTATYPLVESLRSKLVVLTKTQT